MQIPLAMDIPMKIMGFSPTTPWIKPSGALRWRGRKCPGMSEIIYREPYGTSNIRWGCRVCNQNVVAQPRKIVISCDFMGINGDFMENSWWFHGISWKSMWKWWFHGIEWWFHGRCHGIWAARMMISAANGAWWMKNVDKKWWGGSHNTDRSCREWPKITDL